MNLKSQKIINNNSFITSSISQNVTNKIKTNSLSPDLGGLGSKTKFIDYVNKKLLTKSEDLKLFTPLNKTKTSNNASLTNTFHNKIKPSGSNSNYNSNNINNTTLSNYINRKHSPIPLTSTNNISNNIPFNLKNSFNFSLQKTNPSNIPIFINTTTSSENYKIATKKMNSKVKSFIKNINDPRFSNLETSDQEDEIKVTATKKSEIEKKIFLQNTKAKNKSRSSNSKAMINKSNTSNVNNANYFNNSDSFSNIKTEIINDKIIQNTFINNFDERKELEYINLRNNNDTFFSITDQKSNNPMMTFETQLIPDEIFINDHRVKELTERNATLNLEINSLRNNNKDLNKALKIVNYYVKAIQNRNFSKEKQNLDYQKKLECDNKKLKDENKHLHSIVNDLKLKLLKIYHTIGIHENKETQENKQNNILSLQLIQENLYLRDLNKKTVLTNIVFEDNCNSETPLIKTNEEIIRDYKKNRKRNHSEVLNQDLSNNSLMNNSIVKENPNQRLNKFFFSKKDFLFEEINNSKSFINTNETNLNYIKFPDSIKQAYSTSCEPVKTRKQYLFLKSPNGF